MLSRSELEDALKQFAPELEKAAIQAELEIARHFQPGNHVDNDGKILPPTTVEEVAYKVGYARGIGATKFILRYFVDSLKT